MIDIKKQLLNYITPAEAATRALAAGVSKANSFWYNPPLWAAEILTENWIKRGSTLYLSSDVDLVIKKLVEEKNEQG